MTKNYSELQDEDERNEENENVKTFSRPSLPRFRSRRSTLDKAALQHMTSVVSERKFEAMENIRRNEYQSPDEYFEDFKSGAISKIVEKSIGHKVFGVEPIFENVTVSAKVPITSGGNVELPTLWNQIKGIGKAFSSSSIVERDILKNVSGRFATGKMTLVLGQPGAGKSTLMKILSDRMHKDKNMSINGSIKYNGRDILSLKKILPQLVGFVDQHDKHYPLLTVKETFEFAHICNTSNDEIPKWLQDQIEGDDAPDAIKTMLKYMPEMIVKVLGLDKAANTIIGNAMIRGVSGGERKRVTTGEMMFGPRSVLFMDEISTGLDSAATYDIVKYLKKAAKDSNRTLVISLLQPPPEVFELFDEVLLLCKGESIYHGPTESAVPYFETLGYKCPERRDHADFLVDIGSSKQDQYQSVMPKGGISVPTTAKDFGERFRESDIYRDLMDSIHNSNYRSLGVDKFVDESKPFSRGFVDSTWHLIKRSYDVTVRNKPFIIGRIAMVFIMGGLYGGTFFDINPTNSQMMLGMLFICLIFLSLGQSALIPTFMERRDVFYKQRSANFYRSLSYVIAEVLSLLPLSIFEVIVFGTWIYFICGFVLGVKEYIIFEILLVGVNFFLTAFFFMLSSALPNLNVAQPMSMITILLTVIFSGFVIPKGSIPDHYIWIYWISPMAWGLRSLANNQYGASEFKTCVYQGIDYCEINGQKANEFFLNQYDIPIGEEWIYLGILYLFAGWFILLILSTFMLEYIRFDNDQAATLENDDDADTNNDYKAAPKTPKMVENHDQYEINIENARRFTPASMAFKDLWYSVPSPDNKGEEIDLLKGISGFALPGTMTALMGSSGAGKTTLMDVIAGRKTKGKIKGQILLNGYPATDIAIRRSTGYCEQMDIHSEAATIREAFTFSAFLRQPAEVSDEDKLESVEECLDLLELRSKADSIIRGSSTETMKRITIGVELAAQPSILFLDEPTSGLDSRTSKIIMDGVRKIANTGRTIICTIHQPSSEIFELFDSLLLLKRGGQTVFFGEVGEQSAYLIKYFESIPGTPKIKPGYNPATWMLEVIGAGVGNVEANDFATIFSQSDQNKLLEEDLDQPGVLYPSEKLKELSFSNKRASYGYTQFRYLMLRFMRMQWRTPTYNLTRIFMFTFLALFFGSIYYDVEYSTFGGINAGAGLCFMANLFLGFVSMMSTLNVTSMDRAAYYRERSNQSYNALWYFAASTLSEIPYVLASSIIFCVIFFPLVGFKGMESFILFFFIFLVNVFYFIYFGQLLVYLTPNVESATILGMLINNVLINFMGFNPPTSQIPEALKWIHYIDPPAYTFTSSVSSIFGESTEFGKMTLTGPVPPSFQNTTIASYVDINFGADEDKIYSDIAFLVALIIVFRILALVALRYINHQKR